MSYIVVVDYIEMDGQGFERYKTFVSDTFDTMSEAMDHATKTWQKNNDGSIKVNRLILAEVVGEI